MKQRDEDPVVQVQGWFLRVRRGRRKDREGTRQGQKRRSEETKNSLSQEREIGKKKSRCKKSYLLRETQNTGKAKFKPFDRQKKEEKIEMERKQQEWIKEHLFGSTKVSSEDIAAVTGQLKTTSETASEKNNPRKTETYNIHKVGRREKNLWEMGKGCSQREKCTPQKRPWVKDQLPPTRKFGLQKGGVSRT